MSKKIKVAVLTGGQSAELEVSLASANIVATNLNKEKYEIHTINISTRPWKVFQQDKELGSIDLNDFSFQKDGKKYLFDVVFMVIHGTPAEDGLIQGYFDMLNIPYSCSGALASAITFDKYICKQLLKDFPINQAKSHLLKEENTSAEKILETLTLPVFVKPNKNGSSYGTSKVKEVSEFEKALKNAFKYDDEVLVEEFIDGREMACGVIEKNGELIALPITEIIPENEFFDYEAKYKGKAKEVTPAEISDTIRDEAQTKAKQIFRIMKLKGIARVDYFLKGDDLYFMEVNTIPGLSAQSILPQEAIAHGFTLEEFFDIMLVESLNHKVH